MKLKSLTTSLLTGILLVGFSLRIWAIGWALPYLFHPDEYQVVQVYLAMVKNRTLSPHFFGYPAITLYANGFVYAVYYFIQRRIGHFKSMADIAFPDVILLGNGIISDPNVYYLGRLVSLVFGLGTIFLSYQCAKDLSKKPYVGLIAAAFTAVSNANVVQSRLILPNIYVTFFTLLTIWFSIRISKSGGMTNYLLAGLALGLTAGSKYNGAVVALAIVTAHFLRTGVQGWKDKKIYISLITAGLSFLILNIYTILDYKVFIEYFKLVSNSYIIGGAATAGSSFIWYLSYLWLMEPTVGILGLGGMIWAFWKRRYELFIPGIFLLVNFAFLSLMTNHNEHTLLPLIPAIEMIGAAFLGAVLEAGISRYAHTGLMARSAAIGIILLVIAFPLRQAVLTNISTLQVNSKTTARIWIDENIPPGSRIAIENYTPYINPKKFDLVLVYGFLPQPLQWYQDRKVQYLVFGQNNYGRYYLFPDKFKNEINQYETLFSALEPVKIFNDGGYEVRIYAMKKP